MDSEQIKASLAAVNAELARKIAAKNGVTDIETIANEESAPELAATPEKGELLTEDIATIEAAQLLATRAELRLAENATPAEVAEAQIAAFFAYSKTTEKQWETASETAQRSYKTETAELHQIVEEAKKRIEEQWQAISQAHQVAMLEGRHRQASQNAYNQLNVVTKMMIERAYCGEFGRGALAVIISGGRWSDDKELSLGRVVRINHRMDIPDDSLMIDTNNVLKAERANPELPDFALVNSESAGIEEYRVLYHRLRKNDSIIPTYAQYKDIFGDKLETLLQPGDAFLVQISERLRADAVYISPQRWVSIYEDLESHIQIVGSNITQPDYSDQSFMDQYNSELGGYIQITEPDFAIAKAAFPMAKKETRDPAEIGQSLYDQGWRLYNWGAILTDTDEHISLYRNGEEVGYWADGTSRRTENVFGLIGLGNNNLYDEAVQCLSYITSLEDK